MSLLDKIGAPPVTTSQGCAVYRATQTLAPSDAEDLRVLVDDVRWPYVTLSRKLREAGVRVSEKGIRKHRLRMCDCFPVEVES